MIYLIGFKSCFAFILLDNSIESINYRINDKERKWSKLTQVQTITTMWVSLSLSRTPTCLQPLTKRMTCSQRRAPFSSQLETHKTSTVTLSTMSREEIFRVSGSARDAITSSSSFKRPFKRDGLESCYPSALPRKLWATRTLSSCRSVAFTWSDF